MALRQRVLKKELPKKLSRDNDSAVNEIVDLWFSGFTEAYLTTTLYREEHSVDWTCFICKTPTKIHVRQTTNVRVEDMYCDECRPKPVTPIHRTDLTLLRYISAFYSSVKQRIIDNSNMRRLYEL